VTVCIAALCHNRKKIVAVSDSKGSYGDYSADDLLLKSTRLATNWYALFSGDQITEVTSILDGAKKKLAEAATIDQNVVADSIHVSLIDRLRAQIEAKVLSRFGLSLERFLDEGARLFTEKIYEELCSKITAISLPLTFLLAGFDSSGEGHLMVVDGDSAPYTYDLVGFGAIGSGGVSATSSLLFHSDRQYFSVYSAVEDCIYCCCEAKFMAESASDVGRTTFLTILENGKQPSFISSHRIDAEIRGSWKRLGAPRVPQQLIRQIPEMVFSWDQTGDEGESLMKKFLGKSKRRGETMKEFKALRRSIEISYPAGKSTPE
jgi:hypothetical protein